MLEYEITPSQLADRMAGQTTDPSQAGKTGDFVLLDVREPWEYSTAHIEGSVLMPMGDVPSRAFQELDPEAHIVTLCHHGVRSMNVTAWLRAQGFERAQSMAGGIEAWSTQIDPKVPRY